jgi:hypothetical protein
MSGGYTYTTISDGVGSRMRIETAFHLDARSYIEVFGVGRDHVHVRIEHGDVSVSVAPCSREQVTDEDVRAAARLVEAATTYLDELQRLNAAQSVSTATAVA